MARTRLAPSPTGALHLGNARTFLINWAIARQRGWAIVLRIEDLDGPRVKPSAAREAIDLLGWLGLDWDEGPTYQKSDLPPYVAALEQLGQAGEIYACRCSRKQIEAASLSAPHRDDHELRYPGTCRPTCIQCVDYRRAAPSDDHRATAAAWRLRVDDVVTEFNDLVAGPQRDNVQQRVGDFLVATKAGLPSYQLAVVIDDARQRIDQVIRGDDLLPSTHRQLHLYRKLGIANVPAFTHLPLVVGPDGRRLAKRHGDTRVDAYRRAGVSAERVLGLLAGWSGVANCGELTAQEFANKFELAQLSREPTVFTAADDARLRG